VWPPAAFAVFYGLRRVSPCGAIPISSKKWNDLIEAIPAV